ncbi:hypothetical protein [Catenulispora sp. GP43]|uniref:hypothetical protein n=1 Tax=Catenulispora sp. GP43 TaxID=3156263 RepID=UPI0035199F0E
MPAEGQHRRARGADVGIGLVEPHGRRLTMVMADGLEVVPRRTMTHRSATVEEMDLDPLLAHAPAGGTHRRTRPHRHARMPERQALARRPGDPGR